jgi:GTP cyclohydrolase I
MRSRYFLSPAEASALIEQLSIRIRDLLDPHSKESTIRVFGVPRGGVPVALALAGSGGFAAVDKPDTAHVIVDDIIDSGATMRRFTSRYKGKEFFALAGKQRDYPAVLMAPADQWLVFPWEGDAEGSAEDIPRRLLQFIGEDVTREGLRETPARFLKAWREWTQGYSVNPKDVLKSFADGAENVDEMVVVRDIKFYSHCEHHLAPFFGVVHVGYVPNGRIVGLSKIPRLVQAFARRLQVQERMTNQIADALTEELKPKGVGVVIQARHLCMESRGINLEGSQTTTSAVRGVFFDKQPAREEFFALINRR